MTRTAYNLDRIPFLLLLSALLAAALVSSPRLRAAEAGHPATGYHQTLDSGKRFISQQEAGRLLGTVNVSQTYARRAALYAEIARACAAGRAMVRVEGKPANTPVTRLSQR